MRIKTSLTVLLLAVAMAAAAFAQQTLDAPVGEFLSYKLDSGDLENPTDSLQLLCADTVTVTSAGRLRLYFS